jgi:hypothetical protein
MISFLHNFSIIDMYVGESFDLLPLLDFPLFIDLSLYFILLFTLTKYHSWIILIDSFPTTVTLLKSEFWIKIYGLPKFLKPNLTISTSLPHGIHMITLPCGIHVTSFPRGHLSLVPYDVTLTWMLTWHLPPSPTSPHSILEPSLSLEFIHSKMLQIMSINVSQCRSYFST